MKFANIIYGVLDEEEKDYTPQAHYPSSASFKFDSGALIGPDLLEQWLKWKGVPKSNPVNAPGKLRMRLGDAAHDIIARLLAKSKYKVLSEVKGKSPVVGLKYPISYRVDNLVEIDGDLVVLEVKSSEQRQMYSPGWGIQSKGPKLDHVLQVVPYLELVPMAKYGVVLYLDRASGGILEFNINKVDNQYLINNKISGLTWQGIIDRWVLLEKALLEDKQPEPEHRVWINEKTGEIMDKKTIKGKDYKSDWRCLYSPYKDYIWKNPENFKYTYNELNRSAV